MLYPTGNRVLMRLHAVHTCPLWEGYEIGMAPATSPKEVIGWVNVLDLTVQGQRVYLLAVPSG